MCKPFFLNSNQSVRDVLEAVEYDDGTFQIKVKDDLKRCARCLCHKDKLKAFHRSHSAKDATQGYCKECCQVLYKKRKKFELYEQLSYDYEYSRGMFA